MRTIWLPFIALFVQSCLQPIDEMDVDPITFLEGLFSSSPSTPSTESGFSVGGQIYGDIPTGLQLDFSGAACGPAQSASPATTGSYQFTGVPDGCSTASIVISAQPATSFCQIYNSTGLNVTSASIGNVDVYCFSVEYPTGPLTVYEGSALTIPVRLTASPGATAATILFASNNTAVTTTPSLSFDSGTYSTFQNIVLTNPVDANTGIENATITASTSGQNIGTLTVNSFDSTSGSNNRFLYVTSGSHDGNFEGDGMLAGSGWMEKADSLCSAPAGMPGAIAGTGNYRAVLTDGALRSSTIGTQINWPLRSSVNYYGYDSLLFQTADADNVFPIPVLNLLTGGGDYWTGLASAATWGSTDHCSNWADGTNIPNGSYGIATVNNNSLINLGIQPCDQLKGLLCAQDLRDRGDGTISSAYQNLLWQKCEGGQAWSGSCTGAVTTMPYCISANNTCNGGNPTGVLSGTGDSAIYTYCSGLNLGGRSWRVPTIAELQELYRATRIDSSLFPGLATTTYYYSNQSATTTDANAVLFSDGSIVAILKHTPLRIRCVSNGM